MILRKWELPRRLNVNCNFISHVENELNKILYLLYILPIYIFDML
ncbi:unnamed protein product, partial [Heterotrigona itama]